MTEAANCREFATPKRVEAGWGATESVIGEHRAIDRRTQLLKTKCTVIRQANAALLPATLGPVFAASAATPS